MNANARFRLLVVDPDERVTAFARELDEHDVDVFVFVNPADALAQVGSVKPDAVLAAYRLQPVDSATLVQVLQRRSGIPVVLGLNGADHSAVGASTTGARGQVTSPYRPNEVVPILRAIRPDTATISGPPLQVGGLQLNPVTLEVHLHDRPVALRLRELRLLYLLMANADRVVTRKQIRAELWNGRTVDTSTTITVHVQRLRAKLGDDPNDPSIILTVRGIGYRLITPTLPPSTTRP